MAQASLTQNRLASMLDLLEDFMHLRKIKYCRLDGSTPRARRTLDIKLACTLLPAYANESKLMAPCSSNRTILVSFSLDVYVIEHGF